MSADEAKVLLAKMLHERRERRRYNLFGHMYPDTGALRRELYVKHMEFFARTKTESEVWFMAANRVGKALKHGTPVATPTGWRAIETLSPGDAVIAGDGSVTRVVGVYPQGVKPMVRLTFDVGETVDCCADHLWKWQHPRARYPYRQSHGKRETNPFFGEWRVSNTADMRKNVGDAPIPRMRPVIPACGAWDTPTYPTPLDPYALGLLIGDGGLTDYVRFTSADAELHTAIRGAFGDRVAYPRTGKYSVAIAAHGGRGHAGSGNHVRDAIRELGLLGKGSVDKFVPESYRLNGKSVRLAMLQGLMDTDGYISKTGAMDFCTVSPKLAEDVAYLVHSLGGKAVVKPMVKHFTHKGVKKQGAPAFKVAIRLNVCPFRLKRKAGRWSPRHNRSDRIVHRFEDAPAAACTCIEVAHPEHTFVTAHGVVTHNSEGGGGYMTTAVATGRYPTWWPGRKWARPVKILCAGTTGTKTRDSVQYKLLGEPHAQGTGLIPSDCILETSSKSGVPKGVDTALIKHESGGVSTIKFASYDQGRQAFEAVEYDFIWLDEEPPLDVYSEALIRTMTTHGLTVSTFTPLEGISELILDAFPDGLVREGQSGSKWIVTASWDDVPHLTAEAKERLWAALPPHQREARSKGIPRLGAGVVYPLREDEYVVEPFEIPHDWLHVYGMDVGWNKTAVVWAAIDPQGRWYLYDEHYQGAEQAPVHASAIKRRGGWITGVIDPASRGRSQRDGVSLLSEYRGEGLEIFPANNAVESGLLKCWQAMGSGRLKVFSTMTNFLSEIRVYRRDDNGKIIKEKDHLMDAWRYLMMSGEPHAKPRPSGWLPGQDAKTRRNQAAYVPPMVHHWR